VLKDRMLPQVSLSASPSGQLLYLIPRDPPVKSAQSNVSAGSTIIDRDSREVRSALRLGLSAGLAGQLV
ncbi:hypothetical protein, partial [Microbacterium sp. zg.B185]|uniref:hypothetical protein n=1 Tax=Microbacterium sp. zg.B185 TaxID=2969410 RepID=UPI00214BBCD7